MAFSFLLGLAVTAVSAAFGLVMLDLVTGPTCRYPAFLGENHKIHAVAVATQEFALDRGRCPSDTAELVDGRYPSKVGARSIYGGPFVISCWRSPAEPLVQIHSAGPDHTFDTTDDLLEVTERDVGP